MSSGFRRHARLILGLFLFIAAVIGGYFVSQLRWKHTDVVHDVSFSPDGGSVASAGDDGTVMIWGTFTGFARVLPGSSVMVFSVSYSPDGRILASECWDGAQSVTELRDPGSGVVRATVGKLRYQTRALRFSPDGTKLAVGGHDVMVWDVTSWRESIVLKGHTGTVMSLAFSPKGKTLASGYYDGTIKLWDLVTGRERRTLSVHNGSLYSVCFSPDGKFLASASSDDFASFDDLAKSGGSPAGNVNVWDVSSGSVKMKLPSSAQALAVAFSPDGKTLAVGEGYGTVRFWDPSSGRLKGTVQASRCNINAVAYSPSGDILAAGDDDGTVKMLRHLPR